MLPMETLHSQRAITHAVETRRFSRSFRLHLDSICITFILVSDHIPAHLDKISITLSSAQYSSPSEST